MRTADAVLLVVDASVGATTTDEAVGPRAAPRRRARRCSPRPRSTTTGSPPTSPRCGASGWGSRIPVSGLHGRGSGDLLDADRWRRCPRARATRSAPTGGPRRVALVGKPNVGKSSLLNRVSGETRSVVHDVAGTTVDPVDSLVELDGEVWRFVDTAGLRRRVDIASGMEYYASLRTRAAIEAAEVAVVLVDASRAARRAGPARDRHGRGGRPGARAGVQQVGPGRRGPAAGDEAGAGARPGPRAVGRAGQRLGADRPRGAPRSRRRCAPRSPRGTRGSRPGGSTAGSSDVVAATPPPVRSGKQPKILFATQAGDPAADVRAVHLRASWRRATGGSWSGGCARSSGSPGSPIRLSVRVREKRSRKK